MLDALTVTQLAMEFDQLKLQSINQNIANMSTPGFKRQIIENLTFEEQLKPQINQVITQINNSQDLTQGTFNQTHNGLDLALSGDGFFQVQNEQGVFYTRRGDFQINNHGELVTATGETLLGTNGVIKVEDSNFTIDSKGTLFIDHHQVDQLSIVQFENPSLLQYAGNGLYQSVESPQPANSATRVLQGFIEQSNSKSLAEMMDMVKISQHFAANQKVMRTADTLLDSAISQLGEGNV